MHRYTEKLDNLHKIKTMLLKNIDKSSNGTGGTKHNNNDY